MKDQFGNDTRQAGGAPILESVRLTNRRMFFRHAASANRRIYRSFHR